MSLIQPVVQTTVPSPDAGGVLSDVATPPLSPVFLDTPVVQPAPAASKIVDSIFGDPVFYENIAQTYEITGTGTANVTGTAELLRRAELSAAGTVTLTGNADPVTKADFASSGTVTLSGDATIANRAVIEAAGAVAITGDASIVQRQIITGDGTVAVTGNADVGTTARISADGAVAATGSADIVARLIVEAAGTAAVDGTAIIGFFYYVTADGTVATTGDAEIQRLHQVDASGSSAVTGDASFRVIFGMAGNGAASVTGDSSIVQTHILTADGVTTVNGSVDIWQRHIIEAAGGVVVSGDGSIVQRNVIAAAGTVTTTGNATIIQRLIVTAVGTVTVTGDATLFLKVNYFPLRVRDPFNNEAWTLARLRVKTRYDAAWEYITAKARKPAPSTGWYHFAGGGARRDFRETLLGDGPIYSEVVNGQTRFAGFGSSPSEPGPTGEVVRRLERIPGHNVGWGCLIAAAPYGPNIPAGKSITITWWTRGNHGDFRPEILTDPAGAAVAPTPSMFAYPADGVWKQFTWTFTSLTEWKLLASRNGTEAATGSSQRFRYGISADTHWTELSDVRVLVNA